MAQQRGGLLRGLEERLEPRLEAVLCTQQQRLLLIVGETLPPGAGSLQQQRERLGVARLRGSRGGVKGGVRGGARAG